MKNRLILLVVSGLFLYGCASAPEEERPADPPKKAPVPAEEPAKAPEPEYETVIVPLKIQETVYFADGVVDRVTEISYVENSDRIKRKEVYNTYGELVKAVVFDYDGSLPGRELTYGSDSRLLSYRTFEYNDRGLLSGRGSYNTKDKLQTFSAYEYDDQGRKRRWSVYGGMKNILSYTDYLYDAEGRLSKMIVYAPDGTLEEGFDYEYSAAGRLPVKQTQYTAAGDVVQIVEFMVEDALVMEKTILTPAGKVEYSFTYEYGQKGELVRESVFDGSGELIEYYEMNYIMREETRLVEDPKSQS